MTEMRFAYADPPYLGQGSKHYGRNHTQSSIWDSLDTHATLIFSMTRDYPDGWALSTSVPSLRHLLPMCPGGARIGAWVKPFSVFKKGVRPAYAWEPVIFVGGRNKNHPPPPKGGKQTTPKDFVICNITLRKGLVGAKPPKVCNWILDLLNVQLGDQVDDLFPGTGAFTEAVQQRLGRAA